MKIILLSLAIFISVHQLTGQYSITNFNSSNSGLTNDHVWSITFDKNHDVWSGLYDWMEYTGGIAHYDGITWDITRLKEDDLFESINNVSEILFAPNEDQWICSYGGSSDGGHITKKDSSGYVDATPIGMSLTAHGLAKKNSIWFNDYWRGLHEYNYDSLKWIFHNNFPVEVPQNPITAFNIDSTGTIWIAISNRNIFLYKDTILDSIHLFPSFPPESKFYYYIDDIAFDDDKTVWMGSNVGLIHWFQKDQFTIYDFENSDIQSNGISLVKVDSRGRIWSGSHHQGLSVFDGTNFIVFDTSNALIGSNEIRDIEEDSDGNIWVATWGAGIYKLSYDPTGIKESSNETDPVDVFPNPVRSNGELTISIKDNLTLRSFRLYTADGLNIKNHNMINEGSRYKIRSLDMPPGFYFGTVTDTKGNQFTLKIMVVD